MKIEIKITNNDNKLIHKDECYFHQIAFGKDVYDEIYKIIKEAELKMKRIYACKRLRIKI